MWICPKCSEQHEDQFKECWKCAGAEMNPGATAVAVKPLPPPMERKVRPLRSVLLRAAIGFVLGMILGSAASHRVMPMFVQTGLEYDWLGAALTLGLWTGGGVGVVVGLYYWVAFPYEASPDSPPRPQSPTP